LVALFSIGAGMGTFCFLVYAIKSAIVGRPRQTDQEILAEVRALRTEVQQLKQQNHDLFLALDDQAAVRRLAQNHEPAALSQFVGRQ
jgi:hypothetical protein